MEVGSARERITGNETSQQEIINYASQMSLQERISLLNEIPKFKESMIRLVHLISNFIAMAVDKKHGTNIGPLYMQIMQSLHIFTGNPYLDPNSLDSGENKMMFSAMKNMLAITDVANGANQNYIHDTFTTLSSIKSFLGGDFKSVLQGLTFVSTGRPYKEIEGRLKNRLNNAAELFRTA